MTTRRARARRHIEEGVATESYGANREVVIELLDEARATDLASLHGVYSSLARATRA